MRDLAVFLVTCGVLGFCTLIGYLGYDRRPTADSRTSENVPSIGSVQILNGCGIGGAAGKTAEFLRARQFDVKNKGNAESWNFPFTMVISRKRDMTVAKQVAGALRTDKVLLMRNNEQLYDVTVVLGPDIKERIR